MLWALVLTWLKQESVSLGIRKTIATAVIPESGLEQQELRMIQTRVETKQRTGQIMR